MKRTALLLLLAAAPAISFANTSASCQAEARHDRVEVRCPWPTGAKHLRFEADLTGSHDDTSASLAATLDGTPLRCEPGSKTTIDGQDDGDVTMSCALSAPSAANGPAQLHFLLRWYHARYGGFRLLAE